MDSDSFKAQKRIKSSWKRTILSRGNCRLPCFLLVLVFLVFFIPLKTIDYRFPGVQNNSRPNHPICAQVSGEKFMWYAPHSGFGNQLLEFKNAVVIAGILNRTLVVPPILDHHAVVLGSCPKFRVLDPNDLRSRVWNHTFELLQEGRYVSMADIMDLSRLVSSSSIRFIDFRVFVSMFCGVNLNFVCTSSLEKLKECGFLLSGYDGIVANCLFASQEDCRTTVWTYKTGEERVLDVFQANDEVKQKRKLSYLRYRKDIYQALGPTSSAGSATVLAFGSLFTAKYGGSESHIDIHTSPKDHKINLLIQNLEFLPFTSEILYAAKNFAHKTIKAPFLCLQLRLLDGQFKNHWKTTFQDMKKELDLVKQNSSVPVNAFVMTDLPYGNWTGSYLGNFSKDPAFRVFFLRAEDEAVIETAKKIAEARHSLKVDWREQNCRGFALPDVLLYLEQSICSCGSLGFFGTSGSTIAESIKLMRRHRICSH